MLVTVALDCRDDDEDEVSTIGDLTPTGDEEGANEVTHNFLLSAAASDGNIGSAAAAAADDDDDIVARFFSSSDGDEWDGTTVVESIE